MAITGKIKFFDKSLIDVDWPSVSATASSGAVSAENVRNRIFYKKWKSIGSDDSTQETLTVTMPSKEFSRIMLRNNNFKLFNVQYWNGATFTDFTGVVGLDGAISGINETVNARTTNYYEFDAVTSTIIRITIDTTQTVDAEKFLSDLFIMNEIGTFETYPTLVPSFDKKRIEKKTLRGKSKFSTMDEIYSSALTFNRFGFTNDIALVKTLWERYQEFLIWHSGGDESQFRFPIKGTRNDDIYLVSIDSDSKAWFDANTYVLGVNESIRFTEVN